MYRCVCVCVYMRICIKKRQSEKFLMGDVMGFFSEHKLCKWKIFLWRYKIQDQLTDSTATYNTSLWRYNKKGALSVKPSLASRTSLNHELPKRRAIFFLFHQGGQSLYSVYRFMSLTIEVYRTKVLLESFFVSRA